MYLICIALILLVLLAGKGGCPTPKTPIPGLLTTGWPKVGVVGGGMPIGVPVGKTDDVPTEAMTERE